MPSPPQDSEIGRIVVKPAREPQRGGDPRRVPAAVLRVERELLLDIGARERLVSATAHMRLALFDLTAAMQARPDVAGEISWIGIARIDPVADLPGER